MGIRDFFKRDDPLSEELQKLPYGTRQKIIENVNNRKNQILEEKLLKKQLKQYENDKPSKWGQVREGMRNRREELKEKGILKPPVRVNKENFKSPLEEMSRKSRQDEIKRMEKQRENLKSGAIINKTVMKIKPTKIRMPKNNMGIRKYDGSGKGVRANMGRGGCEDFINKKKLRRKKKDGII